MLGEVGYSPVVSPHRIEQVCQPYQVVKVATGWVEICWLARPMRFGVVAKLLWYRCIFACVMYSVVVQYWDCKEQVTDRLCALLLCRHTGVSLCTDIKASVTKRNMPSQYHCLHARGHWLDTLYPKGIESLLGHQKIVRGRFSTFASQPVV